jgi:asparagine synthase (glutamine-hydrolysing)
VQHEMLRLTQINGWAMRRNSRITSQFGVSLQAPFLDDRVLEAALSIRLEDRMTVGRFKPVLAATMRGIAPDSLLDRKTKGDASAELYAGLRHHRRELLELWDNSLLVQMGLVDADALRTLFLDLHPTTRPLVPLDPTLACEAWLRSLPISARPARQPHPHSS